MAYLAWEQTAVLDWGFAAAIAVILLVVTVLVMLAYNQLVERRWFAGVFQSAVLLRAVTYATWCCSCCPWR